MGNHAAWHSLARAARYSKVVPNKTAYELIASRYLRNVEPDSFNLSYLLATGLLVFRAAEAQGSTDYHPEG